MEKITEFLNSESKDFKKAYRGRDRGCRCGCAGYYSEKGKKIEIWLDQAKRFVKQNPNAINFGTNYVDISVPEQGTAASFNKALTFYF